MIRSRARNEKKNLYFIDKNGTQLIRFDNNVCLWIIFRLVSGAF